MTELIRTLREPAARLLEAVPIPVGAHDARGRVEYVNPALCRSFGVGRDRLVGRVLYEGLAPAQRAKYLDHLARWSTGVALPLALEIRRLDGSEQRHVFLPTPLHDAQRTFLGIFYAILAAEAVRAAVENQFVSIAFLARSMLHDIASELDLPLRSEAGELNALRSREPALARLSPREWEVTRRLVSGVRTARIADQLGISGNTVRNHLKAVFRKLGVSSQAEVVERVHSWSRLGPVGLPPKARRP